MSPTARAGGLRRVTEPTTPRAPHGDDASHVHPRAMVDSVDVGPRTQVGAFAHISRGARVGGDCTIGAGVFVADGVLLGERVRIEPGAQLGDGVRVEDDVRVGPNATFTGGGPQIVVETGAVIGANATLCPGITIGREAVVSAGSVVTRNVPPYATVMGNPAQIAGYSGTETVPTPPLTSPGSGAVTATGVTGVDLYRFDRHTDLRGALTVGGFPDLPFVPRRWFIVNEVPSREQRGEHAHVVCHQLLIAVSGTLSVVADDGVHRAGVVLDSPTLGLHLPPMTWGIQYDYSADAALLVYASHPYDPDDYIRDYATFLGMLAER